MEILNSVLKTQWLRSFLHNTNSIWFTISSSVFGKVGGLEFLIKCDFELSKLPLKLPHNREAKPTKMIPCGFLTIVCSSSGTRAASPRFGNAFA